MIFILSDCGNEDCRYAILLLAMEVVSFILDLIGGSPWGYLLASFLLSVLILQTTIDAYFIKRSRSKSEVEQLIAVEIVYSLLQLIISFYCLIRTLSGVKTSYSSSVFPLAYAIISVVFTFKSKRKVSHLHDTVNLKLKSIYVNPPVPSPVSLPTSDANVNQLDPPLVSGPPIPVPMSTIDAKVEPSESAFVSTTTSYANVPQASTEIGRQVDLLNDKAKNEAMKTLSGISGVDSIQMDTKEEKQTVIGDVDPINVVGPPKQPKMNEEKQLKEPTSDAMVDPAPVSVSTSDAKVDPSESTFVSTTTSYANVPEASTLRQRKKNPLKEIGRQVGLLNDKAKNEAMKTISRIPGFDSIKWPWRS